jgi:hypothetical protein
MNKKPSVRDLGDPAFTPPDPQNKKSISPEMKPGEFDVPTWYEGLLRSAISESFRRGWTPEDIRRLVDFLWREREVVPARKDV